VGSPRGLGQTSGIRLVQGNWSGRRRRSHVAGAVRRSTGRVGRTVRRGAEPGSVTESRNPSLVADGHALPLEQLVLDAINSLDPPFRVSLCTIASISDELVAEDSFCCLVAVNLSVISVSVLEKVTSRHHPGLGISDRLHVRARMGTMISRGLCGRSRKVLLDVVFVDFPVDDVQVVGYFDRDDMFLYSDNQ
jgi:hypothetical protein